MWKMRENFPLLIVYILTLVVGNGDVTTALHCYRCDSVNQGESCGSDPAPEHIRNFGKDEPCLSFQEANEFYLALQKALDDEWYFSARNGDHGIPLQLLRGRNDSVPHVYIDSDSSCLVIRSTFHHSFDDDPDMRLHPPFVLWFRKCVKIPIMDEYPMCVQSPIYNGEVELCVCRSDRCNLEKKRMALLSVSLPMTSSYDESIHSTKNLCRIAPLHILLALFNCTWFFRI